MANVPVTTVVDADVYGGIEGFLLVYSVPTLKNDGRHVIPSYVNDQTLPPDGGDFCVVNPITATRRGTNVEEWKRRTDDDTLDYLEYLETTWQIDCYSASPVRAMRMATTLETTIRSPVGVAFFRPKSIDCLFADAPINLSGLLDSGKYVSRWQLTAHFGYWKKVTVKSEYFDSLRINVVNVDSAFPPQ